MKDNHELTAEDELSRKRIETETGTNLFVEASAGSGKTTKLVDRMTAMVGAGMDIRRICAITFTINASREFYRRFRERLSREVYDDNTPEELRSRYRDALENIDLCFLGTIDSFCQMILSEHPMEAGIPSDSKLVSDDEMAAYYRQELTRVANGGYGQELLELYQAVSSMYYKADSNILSAMPYFMNTRDTVRVYDKAGSLDVEKVFSAEIDYLRRLYAVLDGHPEYMNDGTADSRNVRDKVRQTRRILNKSWNRNYSEVMFEVKSLKNLRLAYAPESLGMEESSLFVPRGTKGKWYDCNICEPGHVGYDVKELEYSCFMEFMDRFSREAGRNIRKNGVLDFYDYQYCLLEMLREDVKGDGHLIKHIRSRHSYFLVDEFQDTNPMQAEILFYLTSDHPVENWRECVPAPGSLFIVGDPKQSIYRFRNADVSSYLDVKSLFKEGTGDAVKLLNNFRSTGTLCSKFNTIYSALFPDEDRPDQSRYEAIPVDTGAEEPGISGIFSFDSSKETEVDSEMVADVIRHIVGNPEIEIYDRKLKTCRQIDFRDIMVITAGKQSLDTYMGECISKNIPVFVEGKTVFSDCTAMRMITDVMKALAHPGDAMQVYAALTSGLFDIDDAMLADYCSGDKRLYLRRSCAEPEPGKPVEEAIYALSSLLRLADNGSPAAVFDGILAGLPVLERAGTRHLEYVFFARELLRAGETAGTVTDAAEAAQYLEELLSDSSGLERSLNLSGEPDCVHFANLHKVKGLEAPVVILANGHKSRTMPPNTRTEGRGSERVSYLFRAMKREKDKTVIFSSTQKYGDKESLEKVSAAAENQRLLYVAGTRAGNLLIVSDTQESVDKQKWGLFLMESDGSIFDVGKENTRVFPGKTQMDVAEVIEKSRESTVLSDKAPFEKTYKLVRPSSIRVKTRIEEETDPDEDGEEDGKPEVKTRTDAALVGTMVHKLMEMLLSSRGKVNTDDAVTEIVSGYRFSDERKAEYASCLSSVAERILGGGFSQSNSALTDIFGEVMSADEFCCEYPICYKDGDVIYHGIIDLVYRRGEQWTIIDFKTNADLDDLDSKYMGQLQAYVSALEKAAGISAKAMTYHIDV